MSDNNESSWHTHCFVMRRSIVSKHSNLSVCSWLVFVSANIQSVSVYRFHLNAYFIITWQLPKQWLLRLFFMLYFEQPNLFVRTISKHVNHHAISSKQQCLLYQKLTFLRLKFHKRMHVYLWSRFYTYVLKKCIIEMSVRRNLWIRFIVRFT